MEKQELIVKKDLSIENEKQFDNYLTEIKNRYGSLVVSKETEKDTKKVIAELRKLKREINSKRIEIQKEYEKPAKIFKDKIDSKLSVIEDVVSNLDSGVKQLEEARKTEKQNKINEIIESMSKRKASSEKLLIKTEKSSTVSKKYHSRCMVQKMRLTNYRSTLQNLIYKS